MGGTVRVRMRECARKSPFLHIREERDFPRHQIPAQRHKYSVFSDLKVKIRILNRMFLFISPAFHIHVKIIQQAPSLGKVS